MLSRIQVSHGNASEKTATSTGLCASAASQTGGKTTWLAASAMSVRSSARLRFGGAIPGNRPLTQNATALEPKRKRMPKSWTVTGFLRSRSCQPYRLLSAGPKPETPGDDTKFGGRAGTVLAGSTLPALALTALLAGVAGTLGPDARWLSALGATVVHLGAVPHGVPYASAPSDGWHNVPVLAELIFRGLQWSFGDRGLLAAQVVAAVVAAVVIARDARRLGSTDAGAAAAVAIILAAGLLSFAGIRAQLFSLALFPIVVSLLRSEERSPSRRIWLVVPLLALWSNLHGAALLGFGVVLLYVLGHRARRRPLESAAIAAASAIALCATPALAATPAYYRSVLTNEAATRGYGLWAPLSLHSGFDLLLLGGAAILLVGFVLARPLAWQLAVAAVLAVLTVHAVRNGIWLLMFVAAPAATMLRIDAQPRRALSHCVALVLVAGALAGFIRGPLEVGASAQLISRAIAAAHGRPILAEPAPAEQIVQAGGRVWISNPLDAFRRADQRLYLDWLEGRRSGDQALRQESAVLVADGSAADRRLVGNQRFYEADADGRFRLFLARPT